MAEGDALHFGILTDSHLSVEGGNAAASAEKLSRAVETMNSAGCSFLVQLGDLIAGNEQRAPEELAAATAIISKFHGKIRHLIGNHCLQLPLQTLQEVFGLQSPFYRFHAGGFRWLALDGMEVSALRPPGTPEDASALEEYLSRPENPLWCGALGSVQKAWLKKELTEARKENERVIVLCHFPLHPATTDKRHGMLWNHAEVRGILQSSGAVSACLSGHYHPGGYAFEKGIHFAVLPAAVGCTGELREGSLIIRSPLGSTIHHLSFS
ncbi:metallophosphoesterase [Chlorobium phaeovibrioides]|uniref:Metallophosphoesterase n=1 Tax=Chlorobium phaeovibrioides TaxID=1094 RepID=A0A5M8ICS6_CHLPH|nr:metallophosphoesterase [Chlorobium phaeovibrioides]KAA6233218.1 metallophosphoesterase [Chlorobium phaeovibrioides]